MSKLFIGLIGTALALLLTGCAFFGEEEGEVRKADISLSELMKKMKAVNDPKQLCATAQSYILRQQLIHETEEPVEHDRVVEVKFQKSPCFTKTTNYIDGKVDAVTLFDGENAWTMDYETGKKSPIEGVKLKMIKTLGKISNPAYSYTDIFSDIELRLVYFDGKEYYRMVCTTSDEEIPALTIFVDKNSFLTRKISVDFVTADDNKINYISYINEYALLSGVLMPAVITAEVNGEKSQYKTIEFKLNIQFPTNEFVTPDPWYLQAGATAERTSKNAAPGKDAKAK